MPILLLIIMVLIQNIFFDKALHYAQDPEKVSATPYVFWYFANSIITGLMMALAAGAINYEQTL